MAINPNTPTDPGVSTADLDRRVRALEATRTIIGDGAISGSQIATGAITATNITAGAITASLISAGAITTNALAAQAVTAAKIAAGTITASEIATGTITATNIQAGTITSGLLATNTAMSDKILALLVTATNISTTGLSAITASMGTLTAGRIRIGTAGGARTEFGQSIVTSSGTFSGIVGTDSSNAVTFLIDSATGSAQFKGTVKAGSTGLGNFSDQLNGGTQIVDNTITGAKLVVDSITAREIASSTITANELAANSVTAAAIAAGTITGTQIAAGTITADKIAANFSSVNKLTSSTFYNNDPNTGLPIGWSIYVTAGSAPSAADIVPNATQGPVNRGPYVFVNAAGSGTTGAYYGLVQTVTGLVAAAKYSMSIYAAAPTTASSPAIRMRVDWLNSAGTLISTSTRDISIPANNTWVRYSTDAGGFFTAPANTTQAKVYFLFKDDGTTGAYGQFANAQFEEGTATSVWQQYTAPTLIDGTTVTATIIRTNSTKNRLQIDDTNGAFATNADGNIGGRLAADGSVLEFPNVPSVGGAAGTVWPGRGISWAGIGNLMSTWINDATYGTDVALQMQVTGVKAGAARLWSIASGTSALLNCLSGTTAVGTTSGYAATRIEAAAGTSSGTRYRRTIIDGNGNSNFLQIGPFSSDGGDYSHNANTIGNWRVAIVNFSIQWPGGSAASNQIAAYHGLGKAPDVAIFTLTDQSGTGLCWAATSTSDASYSYGQFYTVGGYAPGAGANGTGSLLAIARGF